MSAKAPLLMEFPGATVRRTCSLRQHRAALLSQGNDLPEKRHDPA